MANPAGFAEEKRPLPAPHELRRVEVGTERLAILFPADASLGEGNPAREIEPLLTLLAERSFAAVHIFTTPTTLPNAQQLRQEIAKRAGDVRTRIHNLDIPDPTDYEALFLHMSAGCREILAEYRDRQPVCSIATASGTPQMQTVWFLPAQYDSAVLLIQGETGMGKERVARLLGIKSHTFRKRAKEKFGL
jgi:hypothetical protein